MELERAKGTEDFPPEGKILRDEIVNKLKKVFELYGYPPFESPILERLDVLYSKGGAGEESDAYKEIFKLTDQGKRDLGLRFELTLSLARFIGMNNDVKMPFKRYEIGQVFRDGPIKLGRYRQFWQCDVDVVGSKEMLADAEMIMIALDCFKQLGLDAYMQINNRKLLKGIIEYNGINPELADSVIITIDKLAKYGKESVEKELKAKGIDEGKIKEMLGIFNINGSNRQKIVKLRKIIKNKLAAEGLNELEQIFSYLDKEQEKKVKFNIALARGLGYYTGPIFEGYLRKSKIANSICGGGRYDNMIGKMLNAGREYPAVGISFGLDVIADAIKLGKAIPKKTVANIYVIPIGTARESIEILRRLRAGNINADIDIMERGISKNLDYASKLGIPYVLFVGKKELAKKKVKLRDMNTGRERMMSVKSVIQLLI